METREKLKVKPNFEGNIGWLGVEDPRGEKFVQTLNTMTLA
tara:strand:- start:178 stop:300 length:123 start_codon:yes stop_codon:yes gene_type:complete